ncbi:MAG: CBS domain-containing protein [Gammaproteobacteria bacterium]|nr:CBS domain-containing protein [Gammaproteobacteria bacterium]
MHRDFVRRYPAEVARRLEDLPLHEIVAILKSLPVDETLRIWDRLSPEIGRQVLKAFDDHLTVMILDRLEPTRSALLLRGMDSERLDQMLERLSPAVADDLRKVLAYPPDCAGALMDSRISYFRPELTVTEALARLRAQKQRGFRLIFIVDEERRLIGMVGYSAGSGTG